MTFAQKFPGPLDISFYIVLSFLGGIGREFQSCLIGGHCTEVVEISDRHLPLDVIFLVPEFDVHGINVVLRKKETEATSLGFGLESRISVLIFMIPQNRK